MQENQSLQFKNFLDSRLKLSDIEDEHIKRGLEVQEVTDAPNVTCDDEALDESTESISTPGEVLMSVTEISSPKKDHTKQRELEITGSLQDTLLLILSEQRKSFNTLESQLRETQVELADVKSELRQLKLAINQVDDKIVSKKRIFEESMARESKVTHKKFIQF